MVQNVPGIQTTVHSSGEENGRPCGTPATICQVLSVGTGNNVVVICSRVIATVSQKKHKKFFYYLDLKLALICGYNVFE